MSNRGVLLTLGIGLLFFSLLWFSPVAAQTFIEPNAAPLGGRASSFLDTSDSVQRKLGSLVIGDGNDELCLNPPATGPRNTFCVNSWTNLVLGGPYVETNVSETITNPDSAFEVSCTLDPNSYSCLSQSGYLHVRGTGSATPQYSYVTTANYTYSTATAIFGTNQGDETSHAGYFSGTLAIDKHIDLADPLDLVLPPSPPGQLCLNGTAAFNPSGPLPRYGCISNWSDLAVGLIQPYVKLQSTNPTAETQQQAARVGRVFQFGSIVAGGPSGLLAGSGYYCGDGLCSPEVNEVGICAADCGVAAPPTIPVPGASTGGCGGTCDPGEVTLP